MATTAGIDIGSESIKGVVLSFPSKGAPEVLSAGSLPLGDLGQMEESSDKALAIGVKLKELVRSARLKAQTRRVGASGNATSIRYLQVPPVPPWRLDMLVKYEVDERAGDKDANTYDYRILDVPEAGGQYTVMIGMCKEAKANDLLAIGKASGLGEVEVDLEALALFTAYYHGHGFDPDKTVLIADLGADDITVLLCRNGALYFARTILGGGRRFTQVLAEELKIDVAEAEELKKTQGEILFDAPTATPSGGRTQRIPRAGMTGILNRPGGPRAPGAPAAPGTPGAPAAPVAPAGEKKDGPPDAGRVKVLDAARFAPGRSGVNPAARTGLRLSPGASRPPAASGTPPKPGGDDLTLDLEMPPAAEPAAPAADSPQAARLRSVDISSMPLSLDALDLETKESPPAPDSLTLDEGPFIPASTPAPAAPAPAPAPEPPPAPTVPAFTLEGETEKPAQPALSLEGETGETRSEPASNDLSIDALDSSLGMSPSAATGVSPAMTVKLERPPSDERIQKKQMSAALVKEAAALCAALENAVMFSKQQTKLKELKVDRLYVTGGASKLKGLTEFMGRRLRMEVMPLEPFKMLSLNRLPVQMGDALKAEQHTMAVAVGLAIGEMRKGAFAFLLWPALKKEKKIFWSRGAYLIYAAGLVVLSGLALWLSAKHNISQLEANNTKGEEAFKAAAQKFKDLTELQKSHQEMRQRYKQIDDNASSGNYFLTMLAELKNTNRISKDIYITSITTTMPGVLGNKSKDGGPAKPVVGERTPPTPPPRAAAAKGTEPDTFQAQKRVYVRGFARGRENENLIDKIREFEKGLLRVATEPDHPANIVKDIVYRYLPREPFREGPYLLHEFVLECYTEGTREQKVEKPATPAAGAPAAGAPAPVLPTPAIPVPAPGAPVPAAPGAAPAAGNPAAPAPAPATKEERLKKKFAIPE